MPCPDEIDRGVPLLMRSPQAPRRGVPRPWLVVLAALFSLVVGCEERERQDREYVSDPAELVQALAEADGRAEHLEVLDLLATIDHAAVVAHPELFDAVRPMLTDPDPTIAAKAGNVLARWEDRLAREPLLAMLGNADPWVRISAASALAILGDPSVAAAVAEATLDLDENVRAQACRTIADLRQPLGGRPLELLRDRLQDEHASVRAAAADAIGRVGSEMDGPRLLSALGDSNEGVIVAVATALGRLGTKDAIPSLVEILRTGSQATRVAAAAALGRIRDPSVLPALVEQLGHPDSIVRGEALRSLIGIGDPAAMDPVLELANDDDPLIQTYVPFVVGKLYQPRHYELLIAKTADPKPELRSAAAFSLGIAGEQRAVPTLRERLADPDYRVRMAGLSALGLLGAAAAVGEIESALRDDPNPQVRDAAKVALVMAEIEAPNLSSRLIQGLASDLPAARLASTTLLTALDDERAIAALRLRLDDEEELIRNAARYAVKHIGDQ